MYIFQRRINCVKCNWKFSSIFTLYRERLITKVDSIYFISAPISKTPTYQFFHPHKLRCWGGISMVVTNDPPWFHWPLEFDTYRFDFVWLPCLRNFVDLFQNISSHWTLEIWWPDISTGCNLCKFLEMVPILSELHLCLRMDFWYGFQSEMWLFNFDLFRASQVQEMVYFLQFFAPLKQGCSKRYVAEWSQGTDRFHWTVSKMQE